MNRPIPKVLCSALEAVNAYVGEPVLSRRARKQCALEASGALWNLDDHAGEESTARYVPNRVIVPFGRGMGERICALDLLYLGRGRLVLVLLVSLLSLTYQEPAVFSGFPLYSYSAASS
jgi:hypothetical protein